jgi:O-antigen/teichoic acid export membrane protein
MSVTKQAERQRSSVQQAAAVRTVYPALAAGTSVVLAGLIISRLLEFVARTALGRHLGPDGFGLITTGIAFLSIISTIVLLGLPTGIVRFVGRYKGEGQAHRIPHMLTSAFALVAVLGFLVATVLWLASDWVADSLLNNPELGPILRHVALALPLAAVLAVMTAVFQAEKDARSHALTRSLLLPGMRLVVVGLAIFLGWHLGYILPFYFVGTLLVSLLLAAFLLRKRSLLSVPNGRLSGDELFPLMRFSLPLLLGSLFGLMVWQVDILVMQREWGAAETGLYAAALTIGRLPNAILLAFGFMMAPMVAQQYSSGHLGQTRRMYGRIVDVIFLMCLPIAAILVLFSSLILKVLFGAAYVEAAWALRILTVGFFVQSVVGPNGNTLVMMGRSRLFLVDTAIGATVTALLYLALIPLLGSVGAAIGTVSGLLILNVIFFVQLSRLANINPLRSLRFALIIPLAIAAGLAAFLAEALQSAVSDWLLLALASGTLLAVYMAVTFLFRIVRPEEIRSFKRLFVRDEGEWRRFA